MIIFATFPRSGHHFIVNNLSKIDKNISYCEKYRCENQFGESINCSGKKLPWFYRQICRSEKKIQKTHDFDLNEPLLKGTLRKEKIKYFSLIRHPVPAIISRWKLIYKNSKKELNQQKKDIWINFFISQMKYYDGFLRKYIKPASHISKIDDNIHKFATYEEITSIPDTLEASLNFFLPKKMHSIVREKKTELQNQIHLKSDHNKFELYDENFCKEVIYKYDFSYIENYNINEFIKL